MAERVVDLLEPVEVEQDHPERIPTSLASLDLLVQPFPEPFAACKASELVGRSEPLELVATMLGRQQFANQVLKYDENDREHREANVTEATIQENGNQRQERRR